VTYQRRWLRFAVGIAVISASMLANADDPAPGSIDPNNWPQYHRTSNAWRYSPLAQITTANVHRLKVAWVHQPGDITNGLQATPIVKDGILYYPGPFSNVFALNAATGETLWRYRPVIDDAAYEIQLSGVSRGVSIGHGLVYIGTSDGRFIALDQATGLEKWSKQITDFRGCNGCNFTSPPQLAGEVLFSGSTGGDFATAGKIYAVNALTGEALWTFDIIKDDRESWPEGVAQYGGGGAWMPGTYDEASDTIFIGTGNASADFYGDNRSGDNKYTATFLALEPRTGALKWHHQEIPHDIWDFDSPYEALIVTRDGKDHVVHLSKSGFVFIYAKQTGRLRKVWQFAENLNFAEGVDLETGKLINRVHIPAGQEGTQCPSWLGARSWNHGAYNPTTELWYTNAVEMCNRVIPAEVEFEKIPFGQAALGASKIQSVAPQGKKVSARLDALDPLSGERRWSIEYEMPGLGNVLTTGGNLVFNSDAVGAFIAYNAESGERLWHFPMGAGSRGGTISYAVAGKQYIVATAGFSGFVPSIFAEAFPKMRDIPNGGLVIAFTLDEI